LLTQRAVWARGLLEAIGKKQIPAEALNLNQVRKLLATGDEMLIRAVQQHWGTVREGKSDEREAVIAHVKELVRKNPGDAHRGQQVFEKSCGQCHKIYGKGEEVGPDITVNGRASFDQLLSNVLDPSLVIGAAYQARTVLTQSGRVVTGLLAEESPSRVVLKVQGGKLETFPRGEIEEFKTSELSLMPEDLEKTLKPDEIADLFAFLTLDRPPGDPNARRLPGTREVRARNEVDPAKFAAIVQEVAPGFSCKACGEGGVGLLTAHMGRELVVRTHPVSEQVACVLTGSFDLPAGKKSRLRLAVAHDTRGDWRLVVKANGQTLYDKPVGPATTMNGWADLEIDLSQFAGRKTRLELHNRANGWSWEFGYWGKVEIASE
jgi:putative heme-binding domain-containing protein